LPREPWTQDPDSAAAQDVVLCASLVTLAGPLALAVAVTMDKNMNWIDRIRTLAVKFAEKANLITPGQTDIPDEVAAFAPYQRRRWLPLAVLAAVVLVALQILAAGGESRRDVVEILKAKPAEPGPPRDIRVRMRARQEAAEAARKAAEKEKEAATPKSEAAPDELFFPGADKPEQTDSEKQAQADEAADDLVAAMKRAMAAQK
jgi:hypothetical protein